MKKKIYFAGSIRGGRDFADLYRKMIEHMQMKDIVLTEHIGQAGLNLKEKGRTCDAEIYNQDTAWLQESDMSFKIPIISCLKLSGFSTNKQSFFRITKQSNHKPKCSN